MLDPESPEGLRKQSVEALKRHWAEDERWRGVKRPYSAEEVIRYRGSMAIEHTLARRGAERLWKLLHTEDYVHALGAVTGNQAVQMVAAGLKSIYVSGWQVAADANLAGQMYPDQSLYPADSVPALVRRINHALQRADQISHAGGPPGRHRLVRADGGRRGGRLRRTAQRLRNHARDDRGRRRRRPFRGSALVGQEVRPHGRQSAGADPGVRSPSWSPRGWPPTSAACRPCSCARTDADSAGLLTSDIDERDRPFLTGERTEEGFFRIHGGVECAIARGLAYAPYCDLIWCETSHPDLDEAKQFAEGIHREYPGKLLAYNCSPSFNWKLNLDDATIASFQRELGAMGYKYQFVTLAGFHALNLSMFNLALGYRDEGMAAYARLQDEEFAQEREHGYRAVKHQKFVGTGFFDKLMTTISSGHTSVTALDGSTEEEQFEEAAA